MDLLSDEAKEIVASVQIPNYQLPISPFT